MILWNQTESTESKMNEPIITSEMTDKQKQNQFFMFMEHIFGTAISQLKLEYIDTAKVQDQYIEITAICSLKDCEDDIIKSTIRIPRKYAEKNGFTKLKSAK